MILEPISRSTRVEESPLQESGSAHTPRGAFYPPPTDEILACSYTLCMSQAQNFIGGSQRDATARMTSGTLNCRLASLDRRKAEDLPLYNSHFK